MSIWDEVARKEWQRGYYDAKADAERGEEDKVIHGKGKVVHISTILGGDCGANMHVRVYGNFDTRSDITWPEVGDEIELVWKERARTPHTCAMLRAFNYSFRYSGSVCGWVLEQRVGGAEARPLCADVVHCPYCGVELEP